jgi:hypothetical protein
MSSSNSDSKNNNYEIIKYIIGCIILIVLDQIWIKVTYKKHKEVIEKVQKKEYKKKYIPFILANVLLLIHFILLIHHNKSIIEVAIEGVILHGIIQSYNCAYFEDYNYEHALIETAYGSGVLVIVVGILYLINKLVFKKSKTD